ncbi:hypothetical protein JO41_08295 [Treponema sp. OMZ 838]|uniref:hypothetical protein n=1 Tax=Treponema sp. OMZ 838 TaxID=1539298 RepID=UPI000530128E|nr:hypothetical protein [Treponema sp. OMZ 838]AIW89788.1 hypothetical protein JO41_08295 [Treponema sp. OMZ 838]
MEFDKSRVYTAVNADELKVGSKCIFANTVQDLKAFVKTKSPATLTSIGDESSPKRFMGSYGYADVAYLFAYLIKPPAEPKYKPFESNKKVLEAIKKHGGWVQHKEDGSFFFICGIDIDGGEEETIQMGIVWYEVGELFSNYVFADDGSPCGELVEE